MGGNEWSLDARTVVMFKSSRVLRKKFDGEG
jgi:hypothetical protein